MGKKKKARANAAKATSRRAIEAAALSRKAAEEAKKVLDKAVADGQGELKMLEDQRGKSQEEIEMERAYAHAEADGEFRGDRGVTSVVPWEVLEDEDDNVVSLMDKFLVLVEADHLLEYPDLNLNVFVNGSLEEEAEFTEMFVRSGCTKAASLDEADVCVFVGGADVDPQLYGHARWETTCIHPPQDGRDLEVYAYCQSYGIPMVGIGRGAPFLHVMNGGKLFQDVDNHVGDHAVFSVLDSRFIDKTPSVHHQMCMPNPHGGMMIIATSNVARNRRWWDDKSKDFILTVGARADAEAFYYRNTCCLGFQGHPEYANYPAYTTWCLRQIEKYIRHNHDLDFSDDGAVMRIKPELLKERLLTLETETETKEKSTEVEVH